LESRRSFKASIQNPNKADAAETCSTEGGYARFCSIGRHREGIVYPVV
jgi:hypothetical protein